jgi:spore germination cell wall hydrolase CwlJ-like protein
MLILSRLKLILLCTIIPTIVLLLGSLTNNNDKIDFSLYNATKNAVMVEVHPVLMSSTIQVMPIPPEEKHPSTRKLPDVKFEETANINPSLKEQIKCMTHNIYYESGGEPHAGQVAVARVVMNRVLHGFAASPCKVIYQTTRKYDAKTEKAVIMCQFSWVCEGKKGPNINSERYKTAEAIAIQVLPEDKWKDEIPNNILFFHNHTVKPGWKYKDAFVIGNHRFYAHGTVK